VTSMHHSDLLRLTLQSILSHRMRSTLTALGIGIGVTAVVLLTSIGAGVNQYIVEQFTQFGTTTLEIAPGKSTTLGISIGAINSTRPLSLADAEAIRRAPHVIHAVPVVAGSSTIEGNGREREISVFAVGPEYDRAFSFNVAIGEFLPPDDLERARSVTVIGSKVNDELYGGENPLGDRVRIAGSRFRVVGVMESKGNTLGFDLDDAVYIPAGRGLELFNREGLLEIDVVYAENASVEEVIAGISRILIARHGYEDFTITSQQQMLDVLGSILDVLTLGVGALGGISLLVGGVGIFTIMTIAVRERTAEIGLLRAIGATRSRVRIFFLSEAMILSGLGGLLGLMTGFSIVIITQVTVEGLPLQISPLYAGMAEAIAILIGLIAGVLPARHAAELEPLDALRTE
jgi:putative ABC transport system permease protein